MTDIILKSETIKDRTNKTTGTMRVVVSKEKIQEFFDENPSADTKTKKKNLLKAKGYTDADLVEIEKKVTL